MKKDLEKNCYCTNLCASSSKLNDVCYCRICDDINYCIKICNYNNQKEFK